MLVGTERRGLLDGQLDADEVLHALVRVLRGTYEAQWGPVYEGQGLAVEGVREENFGAQCVLERDDGRATVESHDAEPAHVDRGPAAGYDDVLVEGSERHAAPAKPADAPRRHAVEVGGAFLTGKLLQVA